MVTWPDDADNATLGLFRSRRHAIRPALNIPERRNRAMCQRLLVAVALVGWMFCPTSSAHAQTTVRQQPDAQVVLEVRLLTLSEALFERLGLDFEVVKSADANVKQPQEAAEPLKL